MQEGGVWARPRRLPDLPGVARHASWDNQTSRSSPPGWMGWLGEPASQDATETSRFAPTAQTLTIWPGDRACNTSPTPPPPQKLEFLCPPPPCLLHPPTPCSPNAARAASDTCSISSLRFVPPRQPAGPRAGHTPLPCLALPWSSLGWVWARRSGLGRPPPQEPSNNACCFLLLLLHNTVSSHRQARPAPQDGISNGRDDAAAAPRGVGGKGGPVVSKRSHTQQPPAPPPTTNSSS